MVGDGGGGSNGWCNRSLDRIVAVVGVMVVGGWLG